MLVPTEKKWSLVFNPKWYGIFKIHEVWGGEFHSPPPPFISIVWRSIETKFGSV